MNTRWSWCGAFGLLIGAQAACVPPAAPTDAPAPVPVPVPASTALLVAADGVIARADVEKCLQRTVRAWKFPPPKGGVVVASYGVRFAPKSE